MRVSQRYACIGLPSATPAGRPRTQRSVCQDIENKPSAEQDALSWKRHSLWPNAQHTVGTRPSTHTWLTTRSRTSVGTWPAQKVGSTSGGHAMMLPIPGGGRNVRHDPSTPQPARQTTSYRPSCPSMTRSATTVRAGAPSPSYRRSPSKASNRCLPDAPFTVFYAATIRR